MGEKCLIWPIERCDSIKRYNDVFEVESSRAGGKYILSGSLIATSEFTDLTIDQKVILTDAIIERNDAGEVASFCSGQINEALKRGKTKTKDRESAFLKLVYDRDPNLGVVVPMADGTGVISPDLLGEDNERVIKYKNEINEFLARTSSRDIQDVHNLARALRESGELDARSTTVKYILSNATFKVIEMGEQALTPHPLVQSDSSARFTKLIDIIKNGTFDQSLKEIIIGDIEQAKLSYSAGAYKACIIMLGASLEGLMLGTLQRDDVVEYLKVNPNLCPRTINDLGTSNPNFKAEVSNLKFEQMKQALQHLIGELGTEGVTNIQNYRNAIHPTKPLTDYSYRDFDEARAMHYITGAEKIMYTLAKWLL